jgi:hypothetical protein
VSEEFNSVAKDDYNPLFTVQDSDTNNKSRLVANFHSSIKEFVWLVLESSGKTNMSFTYPKEAYYHYHRRMSCPMI